jgi:hypothetical protein
MADSDAVRARRARQHKQGDHSLCDPRRCSFAGTIAAAAVPADVVRATGGLRTLGGIEAAVVAFVDTLPYRAPDPRALLAQIAVRLAQRVDETGALPAAVRELRVLLAQLVEVPNGPAGAVDETRLRAAQRRLDTILNQAA